MGSTMMTVGRWSLAIIVGLYLVLFAFDSVAHMRNFTTDSANYVDVARNLLEGRGLVQSTLGFNMPDFAPDAPIPVPFTSQPPLYPASIALLSLTGVDQSDIALIVAVLGYGLVLLLSYFLAVTLYDERMGLLVVAALLFYHPLTFVAGHAWSETLAVAFVLLSLWLLVLYTRGQLGQVTGALLSGVAGGLAFATRYSLAAIVGVVVASTVITALTRRDRKQKVERLATVSLYVVGFVVIAGPVLLHNWLATGALLPSYNPSNSSAMENAGRALATLFGGYAEVGDSLQREVVFALVLIALFGLALLRQRGTSSRWLANTFFRDDRYLLVGWAVTYTALVVYQRSIHHFDELDERLLVPAGLALVMLVVAFAARAVHISWRAAMGVAILIAMAALIQQVAVV
ncbi:MAG: glycosyltransferase family 39 protein, partial [Chloroflexota bacterium]|nr:glycosyltransferase family 39 protein [Chloroflexota bacterium]